MARADRNTIQPKKIVIYRDFLTNFDQNPHTGFLATVTNEDAIKQSYRNLVLTGRGERFYDAEKGAGIRDMLFELVTPEFNEALKLQIISSLNQSEPRGRVTDVQIQDNIDANEIAFRIVFTTANDQDQLYSLDLHIKRVR